MLVGIGLKLKINLTGSQCLLVALAYNSCHHRMMLAQDQYPSDPKNFHQDAEITHKIRSTFQKQGIDVTVLLDAHPLLKLTTLLRSVPPLTPSLRSYWVFTGGDQLNIQVQLLNEEGWKGQGANSQQVALLLRTFNCGSHGVYFQQKDNPSIIGFRTRLPYESSKRYLNASLRELFVEISHNFSKFAVAAGLSKAIQETRPSKSTAETLQRLRQLKEQFEFTRQQRKRATTCYNLSNNHIKFVSQALTLIGVCFGRFRGYAAEGKVDISRCHRAYERIKKAVEQSITKQNQKLGRLVVKGIEIESVTQEELIDQGGFSQIYRGLYKFNELLTVSNNLGLPPSQTFMSKEEETESLGKMEVPTGVQSVLVRKLPTKSQDISYLNQMRLLKFIRNQRTPHLAEYYLSCSRTDPSLNHGIYLQYYRNNLAKSYHLHTTRGLLKISRQILNSIHFLWQNRILHRDLKQLNVLVDQGGNARLIDFGSACGFHGNGPGQFTAHDNRLMATKSYFISYGNVALPAVTNKFTRDEFNEAETFDMYSFGQILANLFQLDAMIAKDGLVDRELFYLAMRCREINPDDRMLPFEALSYLKEVISLFLQEETSMEEEKGSSFSESASQPQ